MMSSITQSHLSWSGITKLRFKPAFNPYTEPSMEVFSYHEGNVIDLLYLYNEKHVKYLKPSTNVENAILYF